MLERTAGHARALLAGRVVWNLNSTAQGGGVAEMLQVLLAYGRGAGVDTRWLVLDGDPEFFAITKRLHNMLHGSPGDGGRLARTPSCHYLEVSRATARPARWCVPATSCCCTTPRRPGWSTALRRTAPGGVAVPHRPGRAHRGVRGSAGSSSEALSSRPTLRLLPAVVRARHGCPADRLRMIAALHRPVQHQERAR